MGSYFFEQHIQHYSFGLNRSASFSLPRHTEVCTSDPVSTLVNNAVSSDGNIICSFCAKPLFWSIFKKRFHEKTLDFWDIGTILNKRICMSDSWKNGATAEGDNL